MATPINDPSGSGFYGKGFWGRKVFWLNVPSEWRRLDEFDYLQKLLNTWGDVGENLLEHIATLPSQRDPYQVRTRSTWQRWFYVTESFNWNDSDKGNVIRLIGEKDFNEMPGTDEDNPPSDDPEVMASQFPWFPYAPLEEVGRYWQLFWDNAQYEVKNVRSRNYDPPEIYDANNSLANEVWVQGGDLTLIFDYITDRSWDWTDSTPSANRTQPVGETDGSYSPIIKFSHSPLRIRRRSSVSMDTDDSTVRLRIPMKAGGYEWLYDVPVDENTGTLNSGPEPSASPSPITSNVRGTINYLSGEVVLNLAAASLEIGGWTEDRTIYAKYHVQGYYMLFNAPPTIGKLAEDYGFNNDDNDPEDVQRSTIANITKFWGLKSTQASYRIRGEISLFNVVMQGLYKVCIERALLINPENVYEIMTDNGLTLYTDVPPLFIRFDHISVDESFWDQQLFMGGSPLWVTIIDNMLISMDSSRWDGMSIGQAFAVDVTQGYYGNVSRVNSNKRGPATVDHAVEALTAEELTDLRWQNGYRYKIKMTRAQYEAFNFHAGLFALSVYDYNADPESGTPPNVDDEHYFIDQVEEAWPKSGTLLTPTSDPKEDTGEWWVLIQFGSGVSSPIAEDDNVAVRYIPKADAMDCCYCRSKNMRAIVGVSEEAYDFYDSVEKVNGAIGRLKTKLRKLVPIHADIIQYEITRRVEDNMSGVIYPATVKHLIAKSVYEGAVDMKLTLQFKGETGVSGMEFGVYFLDGTAWNVGWHTSTPWVGGSDPDVWEDVVTDVDVDFSVGDDGIMVKADTTSTVNAGEVRWVFNITKREG